EEVTLWDAMGRILNTWRIEPSAKHVLDVSDYPSGVYHLRLQGKERHYTAPVWIHR
ncbi:MAG: T9SS C-terminal target domain-containing protein, partial [Flavobacteriia bacterium]|nr:T9SS C-terminal target domain-containing protein [Flavobacteriia bacterium]